MCTCVCVHEYINKANSFLALSSLQGETIKSIECSTEKQCSSLQAIRNKAADMNSEDISVFLTIKLLQISQTLTPGTKQHVCAYLDVIFYTCVPTEVGKNVFYLCL